MKKIIKNKDKVISIRITEESYNQIQEIAKKEYRTYTDQIRYIIDKYLNEYQEKK